ncbi:hypothetical protein [Breoghania sp. L-A4]|uniref:hypothetical protein n=1 Tax=Breoghania sp. L-A4 TaxID=2304600 RepID=UPI0013C305BB|nr:hypothetical protein [Breoghania sp. L-A4]
MADSEQKKTRRWPVVIVTIIFILLMDQFLSSVADAIVLARGAGYDNRLREVKLDYVNGEIMQECQFSYAFPFYFYRTCFCGGTSGRKQGLKHEYFYFTYQKPIPLSYSFMMLGKHSIYSQFICTYRLPGTAVKYPKLAEGK